ncbi:unnamed protein product, partial [marine sediment metagenome]
VDQRLELELEVDLATWLPTHATLFATGTGAAATDAETLVAAHIQLYAQWYCTSASIDHMRLALPQMISDGKSEMRRFSEPDLDQISAAAAGRRDLHRAKLEELALSETPTSSVSIMERAVPDYDPVVG